MFDWLIKNKEWLFSGVLVAVLGGIGRWLWSKRGGENPQSEENETSSSAVHQAHSGSGDNVGRDKIIKG